MADKPLIRDWFCISWDTDDDASRNKGEQDPGNLFSCRQSTSRFLDIPDDKKFTGNIKIKVKGGIRVMTLADGTKLKGSKENANLQNADHLRTARKVIGKRRVVIKTGKRIYPNDETKPQVHTISFAFPKRAPVWVIADALGELIADGKKDGKATGIQPFFSIPGGGSYSIPKNAAALANKKASTAPADLKTKIEAKGGKVE